MPTTLEQIQYGFDRDSRRTWQKRPLTTLQDQAYQYDPLSQVNAAARGSLNLNGTAISGTPTLAESWAFDPTGNWRGYQASTAGTVTLDQHRVHDRGNRLTQIEGNPHNQVLDRAGRVRQTAPDAAGDWNGKVEITWDAWSRITRVKNNGTVVGEYRYDGQHRRTERTINGGDTHHSYYNDQWRPVEERKNSETTASVSYLWGSRHRDDLVRLDRAVGGTSLNETRYVMMDYFNPAAVTDAAGVVKERYAFSAFGVRTILNPDYSTRSSSECGMEFGFQGQFLDAESGLMNYGYRYYTPQLGRWTCKDPIGEIGGINLFAFCENTPVNFVDHLGLQPGCCKSEIVDAKIRKYSRKAAQETRRVVRLEARREWGGVICCNSKTGAVKAQQPQPGDPPVVHRDARGILTGMSQGSTFTPDPSWCNTLGPDWSLAGVYHSHPDDTPISRNDLIVSSNLGGVPNGLGTPNGSTQIGQALPPGQAGPPQIR